MADEDKDKTEPATPFKLQEAKDKGQVAKSLEVNSFFIIAAFLIAFWLWGGSMAIRNLWVDRIVFEQAGQVDFSAANMLGWFFAVLRQLAIASAPFFVAIIVVAILGNLLQTGPMFSFFPLKPDIKRLNPIEGFKRVFSSKMLFESAKNFIKLGLFASIVFFAIWDRIPQLAVLPQIDPVVYPRRLGELLGEVLFRLVLAMFLVAILDLLYTRWEFNKKMRMSRREMKDEVKRREGDPTIRARQRELQREAAKRARSLQRVPDADVLITNPTHLAVGVVYRRGMMIAPEVIAKGAGEMAGRMKEVARRSSVAIIEDRPLARALFRDAEIDAGIPESLYPGVARVLAEVYSRREASARGTAQ